MNAYKDIDTALEEIGIEFYAGMPEFATGEEPQRYIVYELHDKPDYFASGSAQSLKVWVSLSIFTPAIDNELYQRVKNTLKTHGYEYQDGRDVGTITPYPYKKHHSMDFIKDYYKEM